MSARTERRTSSRPARESRHRGRELALQMLYQWEVGRQPIDDVRETFRQRAAGPPVDDDADADAGDDHHPEVPVVEVPPEERTFAERLAAGVVGSVADLDPIIRNAAEHWRLERMNVLDRLVLRLAVYEFLHEPQTPSTVVINEALELARTFSGDDAVRFVNGVLDAIRRTLDRP